MDEDKVQWIIVAVLMAALVAGGFLFFRAGVPKPGSTGSPPENPGSPGAGQRFESISSGSTSQGDVSVELTPHPAIESGRLLVDIAVNTHSVDLTQFDLREIASLEYEGGSISPVSAPSLSGHHNSGTLAFDVGALPATFTIRITGIPAVQERVFRW